MARFTPRACARRSLLILTLLFCAPVVLWSASVWPDQPDRRSAVSARPHVPPLSWGARPRMTSGAHLTAQGA